MRLILYKLIAVAAFLGFNLGIAQTDSHSTTVRIPNYIGLKIVDGAGNLAANPAVNFDFTSDINPYLAAIAAGGAQVAPSSVVDFADIQVRRTGSFWRILMRVESVSGFAPASGIAIADLRVNRGAVSGLSPSAAFSRGPLTFILSSWQLSTSYQTIARGQGATSHWDSLGFNGLDYTLYLNGNETPGQHRLIVRYLMVSGL